MRISHEIRHRLHLRGEPDCEPPDPANTVTDRLNTLLNSSGPGYVLRLCPRKRYMIQSPILFAAPNQEISTLGYPTGNDRATLVVNGPVADGKGHTTAVDGTCPTCSGIVLRNIQIDGTRQGASPTQGGGNIEIGGPNSNQVVEYVRSFDPRSWTCLHIAEGALDCNNATIQNNDIGPCGSDTFQEWADGISLSCRNSIIRNNMIQNPTDGGVVLFGSPGTQVYNNTIWILNQTLLGGINLVDYDPFGGDYTGTVVTNNTILGGFATDGQGPGDTRGNNRDSAIIKIGIAIGPRTWFGDRYGSNVSRSGTVVNNQLSGAFSYAIAITSAQNFTVEGNTLFGNTSFIGARGPNCSASDTVPNPAPFVLDTKSVQGLDLQPDFQIIQDGDSLTCVLPPEGGDYWPFGGNPGGNSTPNSSGRGGSPGTKAVGLAVGLVFGVILLAILAWYIRKWALRQQKNRKHQHNNMRIPTY
ncbi:hypothetical protein AMATHDRAFT_66860 [Amanita thiersii Skay4041]|uniref:Right handed beta helix domain-containing protein n=1 Tax=Amanita thiersii Skay4041 TaxID=703135 RepID=A0A2A9NJ65_9AGAR|nr:hypothetical protein AMATHDRAFT_66860 [Amanita thiersii Skay4041]